MKLDMIRRKLNNTAKIIPDFIDTTNEDHHTAFVYLQRIFNLYSLCLSYDEYDDKKINDLSIRYYSLLLTLYNLDKFIYLDVLKYTTELYKQIIKLLEEYDYFEACYNLYNMVKVDKK